MSLRRAVALFVAFAFATGIGAAFWASPAGAHETTQPYVYVFVTESTVDGRVEFAIDDVAEVLGLDLGGDDAAVEATLRDNAARLQAYAAEHLTIGSEGREWDLEFGRVDLFREGPGDLAFAVVQYTAEVPAGEVTRVLEITFDPFFDEIDGRDGLLLLTGGWDEGEFDRDMESLVTYTSSSRAQAIDLGGRSQWDNFRSGVTLGIDHIKTGPDHILFVLALLLPSVLVFREVWRPTGGFGAALWRVLKIATFFTIAHSITFTLAGMEWLPLPPSKLTEAIIAASIAGAALHNLRPIFPNREWLLAFAFGLFHGMGFASLVSGLEVSRTSQLVSLLGRNVGIEIGQVVVILLLFPALYLLRRTTVYLPFLTISSLALSVVALGWMTERLLEVDLGTDGLVDRFASTPNGYWLALLLTAAAGATYAFAASRDELLPLADAPSGLETDVSSTVELQEH
ncbi:MAG: hypothetical protein HKN26_03920 [Acidimicrobiales bacterium]|nr:hypothetical protein [Acidimicrobiales bacterium]